MTNCRTCQRHYSRPCAILTSSRRAHCADIDNDEDSRCSRSCARGRCGSTRPAGAVRERGVGARTPSTTPFLCAHAAGSLLLLLLSLLAASGQRVRINEVLLRAGAGGGKGGAFVELQAAANVSVAGWTLRAHDGGSEVQLPKDLAPLAPGALLLIQAPGEQHRPCGRHSERRTPSQRPAPSAQCAAVARVRAGKAPPEEPSKEQQQQLPLAGVRVQASSGGGDAPGGGTQVVRAPLGLPGNATVLAQLALLTPEGAVEDVLGWVPRCA